MSLLVAGNASAEYLSTSIVCGDGNNALYGTLLVPGHKERPPVVLLISGSGPTDRDGNNPMLRGKNDSLKMLAEELAIAGFASVRFDKRGIGESAIAARSEEELRFQTYVNDVEAWVKLLKADTRFSGVSIIGHSEGSTIGMLAAKNADVDAFVSLAGPGQSAARILRQQLKDRLPPELAQANESILQSLERGQTYKEVPPALLALYRPSVQAYLMSWFPIVPSEVIGQLKMPVAIFQGDHDIQVSVAEAMYLSKALPKARVAVIKGMNHILKNVPLDNAQQVASYSDPNLLLDQELLKQLITFLKQNLLLKNKA
ncbi:alpha/beta fold hydrolase [Undibacterium sp. LX40W]|uniref:Alpha/beta fold hydrolase n=1 Tax=Undibacterium nitidum TaxID=2762298 RepID=A0A923HQQ8_9BURK|nr:MULTISPECIES: alpha/beta fold hydrolase [Undibacterium]MBC3882336.1 alpha/beta fold hydrolase [Undibacterium nitidum]MBC3892617.1 alpha/beta fold hydrolase [Undibacterium sp. LX40W]